MGITGMSEQWVIARIEQKGDSKCIHWKILRDLILAHSNTRKSVDAFALSIYELVIFLKALGHIDDAVSDLFDRLDKKLILATLGLAQCEFGYKGDNYKKKGKRINDNVPSSSQENTRPIEEHLQVIPFELDIVKQDFEKRSSELGKRIEKLEEEKIKLELDVDFQKLEAEKMRKEKNKAEEDLEKKFQDARVQDDALKIDLLESRNEKVGLRAPSSKIRKVTAIIL
ncbi:hypothetical protein Goklo_007929 [Gossypium klotzschianum]|uniref:Uncharacterized protein n=1 Tax=Gossypium klotzschianum TaxID=34286 RepID=A0A7J8UZ11_9ROSI|nr:hypothetical protein [Gossypium klotzschianum]